MNSYELVAILKDDREETLKKVTDLIVTNKGKVASIEKWGKKSFAYPVKKAVNGYYFILTIEAPSAEMKEVKKKLDYNEEVLRYLLLKP